VPSLSAPPANLCRVSENRIFIDTTLDLHCDAGGKDPDRFSPTMRSYHRQLWSKPLPNGDPGPNLYCAVIVKTVDAQTRSKTSINELLRD